MFKVKFHRNDTMYVVKEININLIGESVPATPAVSPAQNRHINNLIKDHKYLRDHNHPYIVKVYSINNTPLIKDKCLMITEYAELGNLFNYTKKMKKRN